MDFVIQIGKSILSWAGGIILAVLPKCPFCYITYTNSIVICGLAGSEPESFLDTTLILSFTGLTVLVLLFNFRGWRTMFSMVLIGLGATVFVYVLPATANHQLPYILGSILIFCGVFLNRRKLAFKSSLKEKQIKLTSCRNCKVITYRTPD